MNNSLFRKCLVVGIMIIFFGANVILSVSGNTKKISNIESESYSRFKDLRSNLMDRYNIFRDKNLKSDQMENFVPILFGHRNGWTPTELVSSESTNDSMMCSIVVDASGAAHIVWQDKTDYGGSGSDWDIFYKMKPSGGSWTTTEVVSWESSRNSSYPSLAVEPDGTVHVAYDDWTGISCGVYYKMKPSDGSWTDAELISVESTNYSGESSLAVEPDGTVHVAMDVLSDPDSCGIYYKMKPSGGSWTDAEYVTYDSTGYPFYSTLDVESDGSVHIAWDEWDYGDICDIYYKMKPSGGSWTDAEAVTQTYTESYEPSLVVDQDSNVHVTWNELGSYYDSADACYKMKPDGGVWSNTNILSDHSESFFSSSIAVESNGMIHVIFDEIDTDSYDMKIFYRNKPSGGSWSNIERINYDFDGESWYSSIGVGPLGVVHVAWEGLVFSNDLEVDIFYKSKIGENQPPNTPDIDGPPNGKPGIEYTFCIVGTDPDDDSFLVKWDWGDGTSSDWGGPFESGMEVCESHAWSKSGRYIIEVTVRDEYGATVTASLEFIIPRNRVNVGPYWLRFFDMFPILQRLLDFFKL